MILILTESTDPHADHIEQKLRQRGADFVRFDPAQFPSTAELSLSYGVKGHVRSRLMLGNEQVDLNDLDSIWYRRPGAAVPHEGITDKLTRDYVQEECKRFLNDTWSSIDSFWLPGPVSAIRNAELKASQLRVAGSIGFELPPTLFTNSPKAFLEFYREHNGNIVSKLPSSALYKYIARDFSRYTQVVSRRDVAHARSVRLSPVIFQAYVPKRVELRITVVGRAVFAAEIHSQHSNHTRHDWRRYDHFQTPYFPHDLPREVEQLCVKLVEQLGLCYGAIGMVLTPDDRYVFLEINPNGQYLWIAEPSGGDLFSVVRRREAPAEIRESLFAQLPGSVLGPIREDRGYAVIRILSFAPAILDEPTRKLITKILFDEWLSQRRQAARIEWMWGNR